MAYFIRIYTRVNDIDKFDMIKKSMTVILWHNFVMYLLEIRKTKRSLLLY